MRAGGLINGIHAFVKETPGPDPQQTPNLGLFRLPEL